MQSSTWTITGPAPRPAIPTEERLLTIPEVAETCRLSEKAVRREIERGQLKAFKLCSRIRISHQDMREWISAQRQPVVSPVRPNVHRATAPRASERKRATPPTGSFRALVPDTDRQEQAA